MNKFTCIFLVLSLYLNPHTHVIQTLDFGNILIESTASFHVSLIFSHIPVTHSHAFMNKWVFSKSCLVLRGV